MTNPDDRDLAIADDGQQHTRQCVTMGWWLLDWEADCVNVGIPPGGQQAAETERASLLISAGGGHDGR